MKRVFLIIAAFSIWISCNTQRKAVTPPPVEEVPQATVETEERDLDTLFVTPDTNQDEDYSLQETEGEVPTVLPRYNPSHKRVNDLLHTKLDLRFDWAKEQVIGKATLRFKPYFYPTNTLTLDAKYLNLQKVSFEGKNEPLKYTYDSTELIIDLGRTFKSNEEYTIYIEYTATPTASGGSAAITSNQGLFFIDPRNEDPEKPSQIWSQGETNWNSRWFPTIDYPNERTTQEMYLTVEDKYVTLSNGMLASSKKNTDGTRTDYWKMDQPHAPYLFMIAIGEFAVVNDKWKDVPLTYYVEPKYKDHAKAIFPHTPEMLEFFSNKLNVKYPWKKLGQIIVRDYVSGAMENTTGIIYGEFIQKTTRELIDDYQNENIVAHEIFHHWFGDYVTTESWANLTMNEGFANYSEYLWAEYKHGKDQADYDLLNTTNGYISSTQGGDRHALIYFGYEDNEQMFDAHSYNKGGAVLHMLRRYVGEEAFWKALNLYLTKHAYTAVEAHNLRLAFEEVTGEDLNWFFNQWYFAEGHPILNVSHEYDEAAKTVTLTVEQTQTGTGVPPIFVLPLTVDIYTAPGQVRHENIRIDERSQTFLFENVAQAPRLVNFDAEKALLAEMEHQKSEEELVFQYSNAPTFYDRYEALQKLVETGSDKAESIAKLALKDKFWVLRAIALGQLYETADDATKATMRQLASSDPHSQVRSSALELLAESGDEGAIAVAKKAIEQDSAYNVIAAGLQALITLDSAQALQYAKKLEKEDNSSILNALASLYAKSGDASYLPFFEKNFNRVQTYDAIGLIESYQVLATQLDFPTAMAAMEKLQKIGLDQAQSQWHRFAAIRSLNDMRNEYNQRAKQTDNTAAKTELEQKVTTLTTMMDAIKAAEKDPQLKALYDQLILME